MRIQSLRIQNYRSILDSGTLTFSSGFNLVVGANNVGKSSLLHCIAAKFDGEPHKSIHTLPSRDEPLNQFSRAEFTFVATGEELRRVTLSAGNGDRYFPWPLDTKFAPDTMSAAAVLTRLFKADAIPVHALAQAQAGQTNPTWIQGPYPSTRLYEPLINGGQHCMIRVAVNAAARSITPAASVPSGPPNEDFGHTVAQLLAGKIYRFHAERLHIGVAPYGSNTELGPDARNLPEVLNILQGNPARFENYCNLIKAVFPSIQKVSLRPFPNNPQQGEIMIWQVDPSLQRDDLATPLARCGTGVGQVLAMLYVAQTSDQPRTIVIDEPSSFLHPGAARTLIGILKTFSQHQYIIATHSPEILAELSDAPVTIIRWEDSKSVVVQAPRATGNVASEILSEIGARLGDVFGFDKILWVEGQSDALSIKSLFQAFGRPQRRTGVLPVRDTGSFKPRKIAEVLEIYRTLSLGDALLPPAILFLFDRDGRSDGEIADAIRAGAGKIRFLPRRMFENYLLNPLAIARLINEIGKEHQVGTSAESVQSWIFDHGTEFCDGSGSPKVGTEDWLARVNGAELMESMISDLTGNLLHHRKTAHNPRLVTLLHEVDPAAAQTIMDLLHDVVD